ncbi:uncharacterized protein ALTATR162_LOCUS5721 [Alternaria atra]|uniref:Uncharacterized protein n=1 Tax=Alternaria atra TaxID=119953 RepID=A0A8J2I380_9PLEO|nr:uncharacterized protein ALTATR162_LOCUS5721 [Alternaria atra]CAG5160030.1 unnamed protein product [Alternaria atra]
MNESSIPPVQTLAQPSTARPLVELPTRPSAYAASGGADASTAPIRSIQLWKFTPKDFEEFVTFWSKYTTDDLVKSSPFYTKTTIIVDPRAKGQFPEKSEITERIMHAVHPVPRKQLQNLGPVCLHNLGAKLEEERWDVDRTPQFNARVQETLARVDDALELIFRVHLPGTRVFSGRQPFEF